MPIKKPPTFESVKLNPALPAEKCAPTTDKTNPVADGDASAAPAIYLTP
jgi:hypothetical protein